ncbi:hypothetical protein NMY22_g18594 [Coprinellus aureogranulatus]|nr:hypothetical protein NMY22_g18594 [Coprinellus aureogranulatus]
MSSLRRIVLSSLQTLSRSLCLSAFLARHQRDFQYPSDLLELELVNTIVAIRRPITWGQPPKRREAQKANREAS